VYSWIVDLVSAVEMVTGIEAAATDSCVVAGLDSWLEVEETTVLSVVLLELVKVAVCVTESAYSVVAGITSVLVGCCSVSEKVLFLVGSACRVDHVV
jgi:hypothetical protein